MDNLKSWMEDVLYDEHILDAVRTFTTAIMVSYEAEDAREGRRQDLYSFAQYQRDLGEARLEATEELRPTLAECQMATSRRGRHAALVHARATEVAFTNFVAQAQLGSGSAEINPMGNERTSVTASNFLTQGHCSSADQMGAAQNLAGCNGQETNTDIDFSDIAFSTIPARFHQGDCTEQGCENVMSWFNLTFGQSFEPIPTSLLQDDSGDPTMGGVSIAQQRAQRAIALQVAAAPFARFIAERVESQPEDISAPYIMAEYRERGVPEDTLEEGQRRAPSVSDLDSFHAQPDPMFLVNDLTGSGSDQVRRVRLNALVDEVMMNFRELESSLQIEMVKAVSAAHDIHQFARLRAENENIQGQGDDAETIPTGSGI